MLREEFTWASEIGEHPLYLIKKTRSLSDASARRFKALMHLGANSPLKTLFLCQMPYRTAERREFSALQRRVTVAICMAFLITVSSSFTAVNAMNISAVIGRDHVHVDIHIHADYSKYSNTVGLHQLKYFELRGYGKIFKDVAGALNHTYEGGIGPEAYVKNLNFTLTVEIEYTDVTLSFDIYGVVDSQEILGGTLYSANCAWRSISIDERFSIRGLGWINLARTLFLNFTCFQSGLDTWSKVSIGAKTYIYTNVTSFEIPYRIALKVYTIPLDPSIQIVTPENAYDVSIDANSINFSLTVIPVFYMVLLVFILVALIGGLAYTLHQRTKVQKVVKRPANAGRRPLERSRFTFQT